MCVVDAFDRVDYRGLVDDYQVQCPCTHDMTFVLSGLACCT